jgi:hypothetical protein
VIDLAGSELGTIASAVAEVAAGDTVQRPDGRPVEVVEVYDDEFGREGGVAATLVVDDGAGEQDDRISEESAAAVLGLIDRLGLGAQRDEIARLAAQLRDRSDERVDTDDHGSRQPR